MHENTKQRESIYVLRSHVSAKQDLLRNTYFSKFYFRVHVSITEGKCRVINYKSEFVRLRFGKIVKRQVPPLLLYGLFVNRTRYGYDTA